MPTSPRTVVYVANSGNIGGANRVLTDIMAGLDPTRFRPVLVSPFEGRLTEWTAARGIETVVIPVGPGERHEARRAWQLVRLIRRSCAALVHAIDPACYRGVSWASRATRVPSVCHVQFPPSPEGLRCWFRLPPDLTITCYSRHADELADQFPALRGAVMALPNSVRLEAFPADGRTDPKWKFGRSRMVILVGHLSHVKGQKTFLEAAALVLRHHPDCAFVALGGETVQPGFGRVLEELARNLGIADHVHFLGWRQEVAEIVRTADVFALPSREEGLPLALLEAMASSVATVATPVNGVPEVIRDGVNGFLVPVDDPESLARRIGQLLEDGELRTQLAKAGRRTVEERFSMAELLATLQSVYTSLLRGRHSGRRVVLQAQARRVS